MTITANKPADLARRAAASFFRHTPRVRGRGRIAGVINDLLMPQSSPAVLCARMNLGYEMLLDLRSKTEYPAFYTGDYDTWEIQRALRLMSSDSVVFDVGANVGFWTVPLATAVRGAGSVHAFEPVPSNFSRLSENVERNNLQSAAKIYPFGLSDMNTSLLLSLGQDFARGSRTGNASIVIDAEDLKNPVTKVEVRSLDRIIDSLQIHRLDFVKVDIEGHEDKFLTGARRVIQRYRPALYMEINEPYYERRGLNPTEVFEQWMKDLEYKAALYVRGRWLLDSIRSRRRPLDDAFFFPAEAAEFLLAKVAH